MKKRIAISAIALCLGFGFQLSCAADSCSTIPLLQSDTNWQGGVTTNDPEFRSLTGTLQLQSNNEGGGGTFEAKNTQGNFDNQITFVGTQEVCSVGQDNNTTIQVSYTDQSTNKKGSLTFVFTGQAPQTIKASGSLVQFGEDNNLTFQGTLNKQ